MCNLCLEHKKVFIIEQKLYTKQQLTRHMRHGDVEVDGPKGMSGFGGHPTCKFCNEHFYGPNELYSHMQRTHFWCDICKRRNPNTFAYFRDYAELAEHFRAEHFPCPHPECEERKFVVFQSEAELKRHIAKEHSGNLSRAQLREASKVPVSFTIRGDSTGGDANGASSSAAASHSQQQRGAGRRRGDIEFRDPAEASRVPLDVTHVQQVDPPPIWDSAPTPAEAAAADVADGGGGGGSQANSRSAAAVASSVGRRPEVTAPTSTHWGPGLRASVSSTASFPPLPGQARGSSKSSRANNRPPLPPGYGRIASSEGPAAAPATLGWAEAPAMPVSRPSAATTSLAGRLRESQRVAVVDTGASMRQSGPSSTPWSTQNRAAPPSHPQQPQHPVSAAEREANKALIEDIRSVLGDDSDAFARFREVSGSYRAGRMASDAYHQYTVSIGLGDVVPRLAALLPDDEKRMELMILHSAWAPPSASIPSAPARSARAERVARPSRCGHVQQGVDESKDPTARVANAERTTNEHRHSNDMRISQPASSSTSVSSAASAAAPPGFRAAQPDSAVSNRADNIEGSGGDGGGESGAKMRKKRGGRKPRFERLRLGDDFSEPDANEAATSSAPVRRVNPYNKWTQGSGASVLQG